MRELWRAGVGAGELGDRATGRGRAEHAVCGDVVAFEVRVADGVVEDLAWRAAGCPATLAVAAASHAALLGAPIGDAAARLARRLAELGGLARHERHAERLVLEAFAAALRAARAPDGGGGA